MDPNGYESPRECCNLFLYKYAGLSSENEHFSSKIDENPPNSSDFSEANRSILKANLEDFHQFLTKNARSRSSDGVG